MASSSSLSITQAQCASAVNVANFVSTKLCRYKNSNNYKSWKEQMLCLVESQDLLGFIDGKIPPPPEKATHDDGIVWRRTDRLLKGWILGALSDEVVQSVVNFNTARDVWLELEKMFTQPQGSAPPPPAADQGEDWNQYLPLYRAALRGDWDAARAILDQDPNAIKARVARTLKTALHIAVGTGKAIPFVRNLVDMMSDDLLMITDKLGYNALHIAALTGNTAAARILVSRLPRLLYVPNPKGMFPVHKAAMSAHRDTLEFLISQTRDDLDPNPFAGESGLWLLISVIDADFLDIALDLVEKYPHLASMKLPSGNSALRRIALKDAAFSSEARSSVQLEMAPPQSSDIENQISSNLDLCVPCMKEIRHENKLMHQQALRLVKCLCEHMESLNHMEASAIYRNAMLTAARLGIHEVIEVIVETFPDAIYSVDATEQFFFHLAVQNRCEKVFNLLYQFSDHRHQFLDSVDSSGNTILHLAATLAPPDKLNLVSGAALQMQREIQWFKEVEKIIHPHARGWTNYAGKTAKMIFTEEHKNLKGEGEKWMKDTANSCTIAAAFIATFVFAAAITVPGGNNSDTGYPIFSKSSAFTIFAVSNIVSGIASITSLLMFLSILTSRYAEEDFLYRLPRILCIGLVTLFFSIFFMVAAFSATVYLVFGRNNAWVLIPAAALVCLPTTLFVLLQFSLLVGVFSSTFCRGIFGKQSDRPFY